MSGCVGLCRPFPGAVVTWFVTGSRISSLRKVLPGLAFLPPRRHLRVLSTAGHEVPAAAALAQFKSLNGDHLDAGLAQRGIRAGIPLVAEPAAVLP